MHTLMSPPIELKIGLRILATLFALLQIKCAIGERPALQRGACSVIAPRERRAARVSSTSHALAVLPSDQACAVEPSGRDDERALARAVRRRAPKQGRGLGSPCRRQLFLNLSMF